MGAAWSSYYAPLSAAAGAVQLSPGFNVAAAAACAVCAAVWLDVLGARYRAKMLAYYAAILVNGCIMMPLAAVTPFRVENMLIGAALMKPVSWWIGKCCWVGTGS